MLNYKKIKIPNLNEEILKIKYQDLLNNKWSFLIIESNSKEYVLTKEKSLLLIEDEEKFLQDAENDIYYKTIFTTDSIVQIQKLNLYYEYIHKYQSLMTKEVYGNKYIFGSVAVIQDDGSFITTLRGKEDFKDYTIVKNVDHNKHIVLVNGPKATLNAPLLAKLFTNKKVKVIVHINHYYDSKLPFYDYAFPGTVKDANRPTNTSFNIRNHGVIYLFDEKGKIIIERS